MKFLVDRMLGKLAKELRMLGYDSVYYQGGDVHQLLRIARQEGRTILTRNTKSLPSKAEDRIVRISEDRPTLQIKELIDAGCISLAETRPLCRCLLCNAPLTGIERAEAEGNVPDFVFHHQKEFFRCPKCRRIYWKGSHQEHMEEWIKRLFGP